MTRRQSLWLLFGSVPPFVASVYALGWFATEYDDQTIWWVPPTFLMLLIAGALSFVGIAAGVINYLVPSEAKK